MANPSIFSLLFHETERKPHLIKSVASLDLLKILEKILRDYPLKIELVQRLNAQIKENKDTRYINQLIQQIYELNKYNYPGQIPACRAAAQLSFSFDRYSGELKRKEAMDLAAEAKIIRDLLYKLSTAIARQFLWIQNNFAGLFSQGKNPAGVSECRLSDAAKSRLVYLEELIKEEGSVLFGADVEKQFAPFVAEIHEVVGKAGFDIKLKIPQKVRGEFLTLFHYSRPESFQYLLKGDILRGTIGLSGLFASLDASELREFAEQKFWYVPVKIRVAKKIFKEIFRENPSHDFPTSYYIPPEKYYLANKHIIAGNLYFEAG